MMISFSLVMLPLMHAVQPFKLPLSKLCEKEI